MNPCVSRRTFFEKSMLTAATASTAAVCGFGFEGYLLVDVLEQTGENSFAVPITNRSAEPNAQVYSLDVSVLNGDVVYLEGQVEVNWIPIVEKEQMVGVCIKRFEAPLNQKLSYWTTQNITPEMEHMPLRVTAVFRAKQDERVRFVINAHATTDNKQDIGKRLPIPPGYGHLIAEVYRRRTWRDN
jgi:hypothetical protein